ncbi:hypothetical protein LY76DRAFT_606208 [Colletotrichum caudatum]|nr:hypothetical protein LY76DRAFT_606208 [Colletotrichum caudatum]
MAGNHKDIDNVDTSASVSIGGKRKREHDSEPHPHLHELVSNTNTAISVQTQEQEFRYKDQKQVDCHLAFKTSMYEKFKNIHPEQVPGTRKWVLDHTRYTPLGAASAKGCDKVV